MQQDNHTPCVSPSFECLSNWLLNHCTLKDFNVCFVQTKGIV